MQEQTKRQNKSRKKEQGDGNRTAFALVGVILLVYVCVQVFSAFTGGYEVTSAAHVTVDDSLSANGWFFRDEVAVSGSMSETVRHVVYSGERVQQDAPLATIYSDESALASSLELESLDKQIALLDAALQTAGDGSDSAKLDQLIALELQQLSTKVKTGSGSAFISSANTLRSLSLKRSAGQLDANATASERDALVAQREALKQQLSGKSQQLAAPSSGYFSEVLDGYETILTPDLLETLTPEALREVTKTPQPTDGSTSLGKIIQGFTWHLAAEIPASQASRFSEGQALRVHFTKASFETPVTVYAINKSLDKDAETAVLILEGAAFGSELVSMREQPIDIILGTYTGLKVPKEAARLRENEDGSSTLGVLILSGSLSRFKTITPLYETDTFYVVNQSATDANGLVAQDQIIVRGKGLENNMVVKA